ncbi:MAG: dihydroorotase [Suipraeoptans sp.]
MKTLIKNGRLLNPATNTDEICDILFNENILEIYESSKHSTTTIPDNTIDADGCYVLPGLIDMHVHLRDPGLTYKETLTSGANAAAKGGFTTICAMANTIPVIDSPELYEELTVRAKKESCVNVLQIASVTKEMKGIELSDINGLKSKGARLLSEDGKTVNNAALFSTGLKTAANNDMLILDHCEDAALKGHGVMHLGSRSETLELEGIPGSAEDVIIARDIILAEEADARLHICHLSTASSVEMIRIAKEKGVKISAEVCPHHFTLCDEDIPGNIGNYKMAPPLRSSADRDALKNGISSGIIDVIATDHAPHSSTEKEVPMEKAAFGIIGLETAVPLTISELVIPGYLTPLQMADRMSYKPAQLIGIDAGNISIGKVADITIINPKEEYTLDKYDTCSKSTNTPFDKRRVFGKVKYTIIKGEVIYSDSNV